MPQNNMSDHGIGHSVASRQLRIIGTVDAPNFTHFLVSKLPVVPTLLYHVHHVVIMSSYKKMIRVDANFYIAPVAHVHSIRNGANKRYVGSAVGGVRHLGRIEKTVPVVADWPRPMDATVWLWDS